MNPRPPCVVCGGPTGTPRRTTECCGDKCRKRKQRRLDEGLPVNEAAFLREAGRRKAMTDLRAELVRDWHKVADYPWTRSTEVLDATIEGVEWCVEKHIEGIGDVVAYWKHRRELAEQLDTLVHAYRPLPCGCPDHLTPQARCLTHTWAVR